jgi:hypothetical protein
MSATTGSEDNRSLPVMGRCSRCLGADDAISWWVTLGAMACGEQGPVARVRDGARATWRLDRQRSTAVLDALGAATSIAQSSSTEQGEMRRRWGKYLHPNEALATRIRATPSAQCRRLATIAAINWWTQKGSEWWLELAGCGTVAREELGWDSVGVVHGR